MWRLNREEDITVVIVTHDLDVAQTDRMTRLKDGGVITDEHLTVAGGRSRSVAWPRHLLANADHVQGSKRRRRSYPHLKILVCRPSARG